MPNQIQIRNCKSWVFSLMIRSHEANSQETAFEGRIWVWKIQVLVTSGEIIMQTFRDQTQKNVKMSFKELSHPPPEKCNSHVLAPPSNHFMQKTTRHYDDKVTKSCYWKNFAQNILFQQKKCCNPTMDPLVLKLYGNSRAIGWISFRFNLSTQKRISHLKFSNFSHGTNN